MDHECSPPDPDAMTGHPMERRGMAWRCECGQSHTLIGDGAATPWAWVPTA